MAKQPKQSKQPVTSVDELVAELVEAAYIPPEHRNNKPLGRMVDSRVPTTHPDPERVNQPLVVDKGDNPDDPKPQ